MVTQIPITIHVFTERITILELNSNFQHSEINTMADSIKYLSSGVATGKTFAAAQHINTTRKNTVVVVPTLALVEQWSKSLAKDVDVIVVTSDQDKETHGSGYSINPELFKTLNVVQRLGSIIDNHANIGRKMVVITTHASFMAFSPNAKTVGSWHVIFDECPPVHATVRMATRDMTSDAWVKKYLSFSKTKSIAPTTAKDAKEDKDGLYKITLDISAKEYEEVTNICGGYSEEDLRKRKILVPLSNKNFYDVFSRNSGYVFAPTPYNPNKKIKKSKKAQFSRSKIEMVGSTSDTSETLDTPEVSKKDIYFECYVRPTANFFSQWNSVTILGADLMEKEIYHYLKQFFDFEENTEMRAFQDESRLCRDYSNVEIYYISDKDSSLSKTDFFKDEDLNFKINESVKEIVGEDKFIYTQNNYGAFELDEKLYDPDQSFKVTSASHGINDDRWTDCNVAVFMSAINDSAVTAKIKRELFGLTNQQLRDALVSSSAYQTIGRCSVRTDNYHEKTIKFVVFDEYQANFLQTKFKNSKIMTKPSNPVTVEYSQTKKEMEDLRLKLIKDDIKEKQYQEAAAAVKCKYGIALSREAFLMKSKNKPLYKAKEILMQHIRTKEQVKLSEIRTYGGRSISNASAYFHQFPHEFLEFDNIIL